MSAFPKEPFRLLVAELSEIQEQCVRWGGDPVNAPFPRGGTVQGSIVIDYVSQVTTGGPIYEETFNPTAGSGGLGMIETRQRETREIVVQLLSENTGAEDSEDVLGRVRFRIKTRGNKARLRAMGIVLVEARGVQSLDGATDQWENSTAALEILFRQTVDHTSTAQPKQTASEITESVEQIETVEPLAWDPTI